ncbi:MAG TPA: hypothetical protein EYP08_02715 [Pyrodictiaceae archaeon]|nr:hypothetical protein [Pyrodictiaceae archaeon]
MAPLYRVRVYAVTVYALARYCRELCRKAQNPYKRQMCNVDCQTLMRRCTEHPPESTLVLGDCVGKAVELLEQKYLT